MIRTAGHFAQLLGHFPLPEFLQAVRKHQAEQYAKGFDS